MRDVQAAGDAPLTHAPASGPVRPAASPPRRRRSLLAATAIGWFAVDLATKTWVVHHYGDGHVTRVVHAVLDLEESRNAGAAFGVATGATIVFSVIAVAVAVAIVRASSRLRSAPWAVALGLLLGGAAGNLGDRIFRSPGVFRGAVVDWIYLHHWPVFNLADAGIVIGGILAVLLALQGRRLDGTRDPRA